MNLEKSLALVVVFASLTQAEDWPQWHGPRGDATWTEEGIVSEFKHDQLPLRWSVKIGSGYSSPTIADGRVFVTDRIVETQEGRTLEFERVHCFAEATGKPIWTKQYRAPYEIGYKAGPRAAVTLHGGKAYAVGAMGHFHCLEAASGEVVWQRYLNKEYAIEMPIWGIAASPIIYNNMVIQQVGGKDATVVAFDLQTGEERWRALKDRAQYSTPLLIVDDSKQDVLVCWTGDSVAGLAPESGKVLWQHPFKPTRMPIGIASPVLNEGRIFVSSFYDGSLMLKLADDHLSVQKIWRRLGRNEQQTDSLHCMIGTPMVRGKHVFGVDSYGELRCLDASNGDRIWEDNTAVPRSRWSTIHMFRRGDDVWMFNERGEVIICSLDERGFHPRSRAKLIEPTTVQLSRRGGVCWSAPAFAGKHIFARNDEKLVCASLADD